MFLRYLLAALLVSAAAPSPAQPAQPPDTLELFVAQLEQVAGAGNLEKLRALGASERDAPGMEDFVSSLVPAPARIVVKERDRSAVGDDGQRLLLEMFIERGMEGRVATWRMDVRELPAAAGSPAGWRITRMERVSVVSGLYRLALDTARQFDVRDLTVTAPDLTIQMASGVAFLSETPEGPTAIVLVGRGRVQFGPKAEAEKTQIRIFSGAEAFESEFEGAFIRVKPSEFRARFQPESLIAREPSAQDVRKAEDIFDEFIGRTLQIDLTDLSRDRWSLLPQSGDMVAELRTRRFGSLTYARSWGDAEDVTFFDRRKRRNIAVYASDEKLAARGPSYSEDDLVDYDILSYEIDAAFAPDRLWVSGKANVKLRVRALSLTTMTMRLAESLTVRGVYSPAFGRLLHLRVVGQNSLIVNLPAPVSRGSDISLNVVYSGRIESQELEREAISVAQDVQDQIVITPEPRFIYSNRSYWYPQSVVTDYATAEMRITVPPEYDVIATGSSPGPPAPAPGPVPPGERPPKAFVFESGRPVRYLACVISRFSTVTTAQVKLGPTDARGDEAAEDDDGAESSGPSPAAANVTNALALRVQANPRQIGRARGLSQKSADVLQFYAGLVGDAPYPSFTLAVTESDLPGGHSPAYFAVLNQPLPTSQLVWRSDPVAFDNYPSFFLAHELAHQWWGQAIGWKNYHEQWISEGFAQYFAALYAERERGAQTFTGLLRQMRRSAIEASSQGPVNLGYRLGHIRGDSRVFRSLVYNKAAMVLHMLRRFVGDDAFFTGLRRFYSQWRFRKAGTEDFQAVMERASNRDLGPFFDGWIRSAAIPRLKFSYKVEGAESLLLRFEHRDEVIHVPVTVTLIYANGETQNVVVPVTERVVERRVPLKGGVRKVESNQDYAALAEIGK